MPPRSLVVALRAAGISTATRMTMRDLAGVLQKGPTGRAIVTPSVSPSRSRGSRYWVSGYPHLLSEWHPSRNGDTFPDEVSYGSNRLIWWKCPKGDDHEWRVAPHHRASRARGCPFCANRSVSVTNSLASVAPSIAREWHPSKNGALGPDRVVAQSHRKAWWRCHADRSHVWRASLANRWWLDASCPFCTNQRVSPKGSLRSTSPKLAREWDSQRNASLRPEDVAPRSHQKVWWQCRRNAEHRWSARVDDRTKIWPKGCPFCARTPPNKSLAERCPELVKEWDQKRNGNATPSGVSYGSKVRAWWRCSANPDHRWDAIVNERARGTGCPFCAGKRRLQASPGRSF
jgi:Probable Zinc-ribbon domain